MSQLLHFITNPVCDCNPNAYPGPPGIIGPMQHNIRPQTFGTYGYKGGGDYFLYNSLGCDCRKFQRRIAKASMALLRAIFATNT